MRTAPEMQGFFGRNCSAVLVQMPVPETRLVLIIAIGHIKTVPHDMDVFQAWMQLQKALQNDVRVGFFPTPQALAWQSLRLIEKAVCTFLRPFPPLWFQVGNKPCEIIFVFFAQCSAAGHGGGKNIQTMLKFVGINIQDILASKQHRKPQIVVRAIGFATHIDAQILKNLGNQPCPATANAANRQCRRVGEGIIGAQWRSCS